MTNCADNIYIFEALAINQRLQPTSSYVCLARFGDFFHNLQYFI